MRELWQVPSHIRQMGARTLTQRAQLHKSAWAKTAFPADISVRAGAVGAKRGELPAHHLLLLLNGRTEARHLVAFKPKGLVSAAITR